MRSWIIFIVDEKLQGPNHETEELLYTEEFMAKTFVLVFFVMAYSK